MYFTPTSHRIISRRWIVSFVLIMLLLLAAACKPVDDQEGEENDNVVDQPTAVVIAPPQNDSPEENEAYPPPPIPEAVVDPDEAYPPPQEILPPPDAYPGPTDASEGTILSFDRPLTPGSTIISGDGPPGLLVHILNVTQMGKLEGSGIIGDDGRFSISVPPLVENVRLGVTTDNAMQSLADANVLPGEGEFSVPQVGYFYDTLMVR